MNPSFVETFRSLAGNVSWAMAGTVISVGCNFLFVVMVARRFAPEEVAAVAVAAILTALLEALSSGGVPTLLLKRLPALAPESGAARSLVWTHFAFAALPGGVMVVAGVLLAGTIARFLLGDAARYPLVAPCLLIAYFTTLTNSALIVLRAEQRFAEHGFLLALGSLCDKVIVVAVAIWRDLSVHEFLWLAAVLGSLRLAISATPVLIRFRSGIPPLAPPKQLFFEAKPFYWSALLRYGSTQADQFLVAALFAPQALAVYYVLRRLFAIILLVIATVTDALVPMFAQRAGTDPAAARRSLVEWSSAVVALGTVGAALITGNGAAFLHFVLGRHYGSDGLLMALFAVATLTTLAFSMAQVEAVLFHEPARSFRLWRATVVVNLSAAVVAGALIGVHGILVAMIVSQLAGLALASHWGTQTLRPASLAVPFAIVLSPSALLAVRGTLPPHLPTILLNIWIAGWAAYYGHRIISRKDRKEDHDSSVSGNPLGFPAH